MSAIDDILRAIEDAKNPYNLDPIDYRIYDIVRDLALRVQEIERRPWDGEAA